MEDKNLEVQEIINNSIGITIFLGVVFIAKYYHTKLKNIIPLDQKQQKGEFINDTKSI